MKTYMFWDNEVVRGHKPEAFRAPNRIAALNRFTAILADAFATNPEEERAYLKGRKAGLFVDGQESTLSHLGFRLAEVELKEYK